MEAFTLSDSEQFTILEALNALAAIKAAAFRDLKAAAPSLCEGPTPFTERDFGIPQIAALAAKIGGPD